MVGMTIVSINICQTKSRNNAIKRLTNSIVIHAFSDNHIYAY